MAQISSFIIAKNEANRITKAINSLKNIVDEIIVVDSGSTDDTVAIAESLGARVVFNEWRGYVAQKAFGESLCKHDWILNIDADEELSKELQDEIEFIFSSRIEDRYLAYSMNVVIMRRMDLAPRLFAPRNRVIRLYNRKACSFANSTKFTTRDSVLFNEGVDYKNKVYDLFGQTYHRSGTSISQLVSKANFYSSEQAEDLIKSGRVPGRMRIGLELFFCFIKAFFFRRYFIFGFDGFVDSLIFAFARFIRLAKAREIFLEKNKNK